MTEVTFTHVGGPTLLVEFEGLRLLTDPTFDAPGRRYDFGWGTSSTKVAGPALTPEEIGPVDAVLLSHDHHDDNLDAAGRAFLKDVPLVITTHSGAARIGGTGLRPGESTRLNDVTITATPCRHGPPLSHPIVGDVIGFALEWPGQTHGPLWITGDTVLYAPLRGTARRLKPGTVVFHLGGVRFPITGPLRYTMTGRDAVTLLGDMAPANVFAVHWEGWSHFLDGREGIVQAQLPLTWFPMGEGLTAEV
ncbi:MBL fold metallo-hydrolase [Herbidospora sp. NBRC 101105]|uniref:MBL fold metallo-hydrolase n=1 Tax=Herbidospora sp. NBRC 101105 TaxID=3032195 RepID=UPI0024A014A9|nr:MBL fold metallo-hydrolase [Herbidospora sp. NBRC 101105]GLX94987.1 MBL fold metallo-hydrolase [Herbidospora sp. NBRC 101105]